MHTFMIQPLAVSVFKKMSYWHSRGGQGFYKFLQPCNHRHYREGDSWCEELDMSEKTFRKHLKSVCTIHQNRQAFYQSKDPYQGNPFACFHDRVNHKTFYFGNDELIAQHQKILSKEEGRGVKKFTPPFRVGSESIYRNNNKQFSNPPKSPLRQNDHGEEGRLFPQKDFKKAEKMVSIWTEQTKGNIPVPKLSRQFAQKLLTALKEHFQNSLETWTNYCKSVGSSKFLLGKVSEFKAWLVWVIRGDVIEKVKKQAYGILHKFIMMAPLKPINGEKEVSSSILLLSESAALKKLRLNLLKKIGIDSYVSWFSKTSLRIDDGEVVAENKQRFTQEKAQQLLILALDKNCYY